MANKTFAMTLAFGLLLAGAVMAPTAAADCPEVPHHCQAMVEEAAGSIVQVHYVDDLTGKVPYVEGGVLHVFALN